MDPNKIRQIKQLFVVLLIVAFIVSLVAYFFFLFQTPIYQAQGKISITYVIKPEDNTNIVAHLKSDENLARYYSEVIKSEDFVKDLFSASGVAYNRDDYKDVTDFVKADFVAYTNVIKIRMTDKDQGKLKKLTGKFVLTLSQEKYMTADVMETRVNVLDEVKVTDKPIYPEPLKYALVIFVSILFVGSLLIYSFS